MKKNNHTPGPWKNINSRYIDTEAGTRIAEVYNHTAPGYIDNAQLIAAAPELLDALEGLLNAFIHTDGNVKGNSAKTDIIKYNEDVRQALVNAHNVLWYKLKAQAKS